MAEKKNEQTQEHGSEKEKKKEEKPMPFCTTAASAEHSRSEDTDDPCDDGRTGDYEREDQKE